MSSVSVLDNIYFTLIQIANKLRGSTISPNDCYNIFFTLLNAQNEMYKLSQNNFNKGIVPKPDMNTSLPIKCDKKTRIRAVKFLTEIRHYLNTFHPDYYRMVTDASLADQLNSLSMKDELSVNVENLIAEMGEISLKGDDVEDLSDQMGATKLSYGRKRKRCPNCLAKENKNKRKKGRDGKMWKSEKKGKCKYYRWYKC